MICAEAAHIYADECGAPEKFTGCKLIPIPTENGKLTVEAAGHAYHGIGDQHHVQPRVVSITQVTEVGTVYKPQEIRDLARFAHERKMFLHMDGARIANAAVSLELTLRQATRDLGVDVLSFGGTKNGALGAEAVVFFNKQFSRDFLYLRKQGMQLASKMRYISVQLDTLLTNDFWRKNAEHANRMARLLEQEVKRFREQELIRAKNNLELARAQLNTAMGVPADALYQPADPLAERGLAAPSLADVEQKALTSRPDLKRIESEQSAQQLNVAIAKSSFGPRLNAFAGWEMDNPTLLAGGGGNNWLGGIELQLDLFEGGAKRAALSREHAIAEKMAALKQAASDAVRLEVRQAYFDLDSNRQQVGVARSSIAQAQESLRINQDRYEGGLITITDLLGAEEAARRSQTDYWQAVYQFHISSANLELASGTLNLQSPAVNP